MRRRFDALDIPMHNQQMRLQLELELRGQSALYGRRLTYTRLKQLGISAIRDRAYEITRELDPVGISSRQFGKQKVPRGNYSVAGPNRILSVDGHHKLSLYGFEVYAGVDA
jgi:hypothetical protein